MKIYDFKKKKKKKKPLFRGEKEVILKDGSDRNSKGTKKGKA